MAFSSALEPLVHPMKRPSTIDVETTIIVSQRLVSETLAEVNRLDWGLMDVLGQVRRSEEAVATSLALLRQFKNKNAERP